MRSGTGLILILLLAPLFVLQGTARYGVGASPDSVGYAYAARELWAQGQLVDIFSAPLVYFPPLYPTVLSLVVPLGGDPLVAARWLNAGLLAVTIGLADTWLLARMQPGLRWVGRGALLASWPMLAVARFAWSETLFVCFTVACLGALAHHQEHPSRLWLGVATGLAGLASLTRYMGLALVLAGAITLSGRRRWIYFVGSTLPVAAWMIRNYWAAGTFTGDRSHAVHGSLLINLWQCLDVMGRWFLPSSVAGLLVLALLGAGCLKLKADRRRSRVSESFLVIYLAALGALTTWTREDPIGDRYLAPLFVPLLVLLLNGAQSLQLRLPRLGFRLLLGTLVLLLVIGPGWRVIEATRSARWFGAGGYASRTWHDDPMVRWARGHALPGRVLSNDPFAYLYFTGRPADLLDLRERPRGTSPWAGIGLKGTEFSEPRYLVTFNNPLRLDTSPWPVEKAHLAIRLELVEQNPGGEVYLIKPRRAETVD